MAMGPSPTSAHLTRPAPAVIASRLTTGERFATVYDGHVGEATAEFAMRTMPACLESEGVGGATDVPAALTRALTACHERCLREVQDGSGSTATVAVVGSGKLHVAIVGNCRAVLCSGGTADVLTKDKKPELLHRGLINEEEQPKPLTVERTLSAEDAFVIIASDGVWSAQGGFKGAQGNQKVAAVLDLTS